MFNQRIFGGGNNDSSWQPLLHDPTNEGLAFKHERRSGAAQNARGDQRRAGSDGFLFQLYSPEGDDVSVYSDRADVFQPGV